MSENELFEQWFHPDWSRSSFVDEDGDRVYRDIWVQAALAEKPDEGCPLCNGDCSAANPPVMNCPMDK